MKRALVTGPTGFIGRNTLAPLQQRGYEVHALAIDEPLDDPPGVRWHRADLMDLSAVAEVLAEVRPTHLLHLAWYAIPGKYVHSLENLRWVRASLALAEAFAAQGGRRIVTAGTSLEYDPREGPCREDQTPLLNTSLYSSCKGCMRLMLEALGRQAGISTAHGRVFFLYGPHEYPQRLVASVCLALLGGERARCTHGRQIRDFLHVCDVAEALVALLDSEVAGPVNIASGRGVSLGEIVATLAELAGRADLVEMGAIPAPPEEPPSIVADVTRLSAEVGWRPRYALRAGLEQTVAWWRDLAGSAAAGSGRLDKS